MLENDLSGVKVGSWIWTICSGWEKVTVAEQHREISYTIETDTESYTSDGKVFLGDKYPSAFVEPPECFNAEPKPCEFVKGQRVLVSDSQHYCDIRRYFSHEENGLFHCFKDGKTEWTSEGKTTTWNYCIPAEEEE